MHASRAKETLLKWSRLVLKVFLRRVVSQEIKVKTCLFFRAVEKTFAYLKRGVHSKFGHQWNEKSCQHSQSIYSQWCRLIIMVLRLVKIHLFTKNTHEL